jgi:uncharacterized membrane-anchored protein YhcB (DUF1043 family)
MPLWVLFVFGVFIGILVGWTACWLAQSKHRKLARDRGREISSLQTELENVKTPVSQETMIAPYVGLLP